LVDTLTKEIRTRGHDVDVIELPFNPLPKQNLVTAAAMWRALDLSTFCGQSIDLVIPTKFPSYYVRHPKKSLWLVHQLRSIYDLYGGQFSDIGDDPRDEALRKTLVEGDTKTLGECAYRGAISQNVADRLAKFNGLTAQVLYPPLPLGNRYRSAEPEPYILSVGRLCRIKRLDLMLMALAHIPAMRLKVVGVSDEPGSLEYFQNVAGHYGVSPRVDFLGRVSEEELIELHARATATYYAPFNEDYGYVTIEAMASGKPVVTTHDAGGPLEFIRHEENGLIVDPTPEAVGAAFNRLIQEPTLAREMGARGRAFIEDSGMLEGGWDRVISELLSPLSGCGALTA
jgi:glycosyltransferase involved in cell wall biosynthesis